MRPLQNSKRVAQQFEYARNGQTGVVRLKRFENDWKKVQVAQVGLVLRASCSTIADCILPEKLEQVITETMTVNLVSCWSYAVKRTEHRKRHQKNTKNGRGVFFPHDSRDVLRVIFFFFFDMLRYFPATLLISNRPSRHKKGFNTMNVILVSLKSSSDLQAMMCVLWRMVLSVFKIALSPDFVPWKAARCMILEWSFSGRRSWLCASEYRVSTYESWHL